MAILQTQLQAPVYDSLFLWGQGEASDRVRLQTRLQNAIHVWRNQEGKKRKRKEGRKKGRKEGRKAVVFVHVPMCRKSGTKPVLLMCEGRNWKERSMLSSDQSFVRLSPLHLCPFLAANRGRARYNFGSRLFTAVSLLASVLVKICPFGFLIMYRLFFCFFLLFSCFFFFLCLYLPSVMCSL